MISREILEELYTNKEMSMKEVSQQLNVSIGSVYNYIKKYNIQSRPRMTEKVKRKISKQNKGKPSVLKGKKMSEDAKIKMSLAKKGKYHKVSKYGGHTKKRGDGYISVYKPDHPYASKDGYVMEHILVMENHIGRYLAKDEVVHHINKNRSDNRLENLQLMTFKEHAGLHMKERWDKKKGGLK